MKRNNFFILVILIMIALIGIRFIGSNKLHKKEIIIPSDNIIEKSNKSNERNYNIKDQKQLGISLEESKKETLKSKKTKKSFEESSKKVELEEFFKKIKANDFSCSKQNTDCR
jgi:FtsZ-interacting cell division protein ZipA